MKQKENPNIEQDKLRCPEHVEFILNCGHKTVHEIIDTIAKVVNKSADQVAKAIDYINSIADKVESDEYRQMVEDAKRLAEEAQTKAEECKAIVEQLSEGIIGEENLADGAVTKKKLGEDVINSLEELLGYSNSLNIKFTGLYEALNKKIVESEFLADGAVTLPKLADDVIDKIADVDKTNHIGIFANKHSATKKWADLGCPQPAWCLVGNVTESDAYIIGKDFMLWKEVDGDDAAEEMVYLGEFEDFTAAVKEWGSQDVPVQAWAKIGGKNYIIENDDVWGEKFNAEAINIFDTYGLYKQAEYARDAAFAEKEATRDAANEAALNAAETLEKQGEDISQLAHKTDEIKMDIDGEKNYEFSSRGGYYLNGDNLVFYGDDDWCNTGKIYFRQGYKLTLISVFQSGIAIVWVAFDKNGNMVSNQVTKNSGGSTIRYTLDWSENIDYIICCTQTNLKQNCSCVVSKDDSINSQLQGKFDKSNLTNNVNTLDDTKAVTEFGGVLISNPFSAIDKGFININGKFISFPSTDINSYVASNWCPINDNTKSKKLNNLLSHVRIGLVGLSFYRDISESSFIGYYRPDGDNGNTQDEVLFDVRIKDAIDSNSNFAEAKYCRFTQRGLYSDPNDSIKIERLCKGLEFNNVGIIKADGSYQALSGETYRTSDYIVLDDVSKNMIINGLTSYARASVYAIAFYDENKSVIGTAYKDPSDDASTTMEKLCSVNIGELAKSYPNASYFRATISTTYGFSTDSINERNNFMPNWRDKAWVLNQFTNVTFLGDSVTQGFVADYPIYEVVPSAAYPTKIKNFMPNWNVVNLGRAGDSSLDCYSGGEGRPAIYPTHDFSNDELVIIEFGYNTNQSHGGALNINDINSPNTSTYAYDQMIKGIKSQNPKVEIVCIIPSNAKITNNWGGVITTLAQNNSCKLINLNEDLFVHLDTPKWHGASDAQGTIDMVHFTKAGYNAKAFVVFNKLIEVFSTLSE
ncbi:MAG: GDSL-type esterase/lipase family protein [Prevotella sp.]|nr:GDSL-type esterase/lipase family protein [Prevotella sp.]